MQLTTQRTFNLTLTLSEDEAKELARFLDTQVRRDAASDLIVSLRNGLDELMQLR